MCIEVDECAAATHDCHPLADCTNTAGSFTCACKPGTEGDGKSCTAFASCNALLAAQAVGDGIYPLDPDGMGPGPSFDAYCDMTTDGGGWTLIMKLTSATETFRFDAPYWENTDTLNEADLTPNTTQVMTGEAKYVAYNFVRGDTLRLRWLDPADHNFIYSAVGGRTALELFQGGEDQVEGDEDNLCNGQALTGADGYLGSHMRHASAAQFYGINGDDSGNGNASTLRFGFGSNDEPINPWEPRQAAGGEDNSLVWESSDDCNNCGCYGNAYNPTLTAANMWVR